MPNDAPKTRFSLKAILAAMAVVAVLVGPIGWLGELYVTSLVISCVMLALVLWGVLREKTVVPLLACGIPFLTIPAMYVSPVALWQGIMSAGIVLVSAPWTHRPAVRASLCVAAMAGVYVWALVDAHQRSRDFDLLRGQFPITSLADRLPATNEAETLAALSENTESNLTTIEGWYDRAQRQFRYRADLLEMLHQDATRRFVTAEGFGVMRMPIGYWMQEEQLAAPNLATQAPRLTGFVGEVSESTLTPVQNLLHFQFFNTDSLGFIESKEHTVGFLPHGLRDQDSWDRWITESKSPTATWNLTRLELIGLLRHAEPVVYVMEGLPSMDRVAGAETRPLDEFEAAALPMLASEHDLKFEETGEGVRMVGAIRAAEQCLTCHEVPRGTLLGAFSYDLVREEASTETAD